MSSIVTLDPLQTLGPNTLSDELEQGKVVCFPTCPIPLPPAEDIAFLRDEMARHLRRKNVSYHSEVDRVLGIRAPKPIRERTWRILRDHFHEVRRFLERVIPAFTPGWRPGTASFRPLQERGRNISPHASSELLHVDARAYGATHGDRILRFFVNVNPEEDRVWVTRGTFPELYAKYAASAGIAGNARNRDLEKGFFNRVFSALVNRASRLGLPMLKLVDTSPYDRLMARFHNFMKDSKEFQQGLEGRQELRFSPFSAWMVLTDMVSHGCVSGQHAFIDTFIIPLRNCRLPHLAPYHVLKGENLSQRAAAPPKEAR